MIRYQPLKTAALQRGQLEGGASGPGAWYLPWLMTSLLPGSATVCPQNDEEAMVEAVALYNPVSFAFEVTNDFMLYRKGIYSR